MLGLMAKDTRTGDRHRLPKRGVYVELELWEGVKAAAERDGRTLNDAIVELLHGYVGGKFRIGSRRNE